MDNSNIDKVVEILREEYNTHQTPVVTEWAINLKDPFYVLISCILSLRTKDETTRQASIRLFDAAKTPGQLAELHQDKIAELIYPVGFYKNKSVTIKEISKKLVCEYNSKVPDTIDELLKFKGVGRKTANLVVTLGYNKPGICVDIHVHRISNRLGYIKTNTPEKSEFALREILPKKYWLEYNDLLVSYGQNTCTPVSPFCSRCRISPFCDKKDVDKMR
jgi:endonuclease-3